MDRKEKALDKLSEAGNSWIHGYLRDRAYFNPTVQEWVLKIPIEMLEGLSVGNLVEELESRYNKIV